ncbi:LEM domain-containing protein 1 [Denticeps clupeoides]|uniref:LEM domain-containing protein n=1 Tax=Denticeps clupeoides TaxID=299321 RepID=A0AAY4E4H5_9TELE|nr:lamina-associated polypeptide 2, isoforms beta/gamma-like [Denticeps clupeoides]
MPELLEDPAHLSKARLESELAAHSVPRSKKQVYVARGPAADFSSDEEAWEPRAGGGGGGGGEEEKSDYSDMRNPSLLTDEQLKTKLLQFGVKAGPIVASTRSLYERKLQKLMKHGSQPKQNGTRDAGRYSDSEEEVDDEEEEDIKADEETDSLNKVDHEDPASDLLTEMFPGTEMSPTGIVATCRKPIKGAAGRPIQYKYPTTPLTPASAERQEIQRCMVPMPMQIGIFLLVICLLYLIYAIVEDNLENPFSALLDNLSKVLEATDEALTHSN